MLPSTCSKVSVRLRPAKDGRMSLYLDYYPPIRNPRTMKLSRREGLGFFIYAAPKDRQQKDYNDSMLMRAEIIRCRRQEAVINQEFGFLDRGQQNADFLKYFESQAKSKPQKWKMVFMHFSRFVGGQCTFGDLSLVMCRKFRDYLLGAYQLRHSHLKLTRNSAARYFSSFRGLLRMAYRERLIKDDINLCLDAIAPEEVKKNFLTVDEVKTLAATPCEIPVLKSASLFAILTGLRISDIIGLRWEDIRPDSLGEPAMFIRIKKTRRESVHPLSRQMLDLCGERGRGQVFKGLKRSMIQHPLRKWLFAAGITKRITFHRFRDTFATLQLAAGTDIYTVSKMLDHSSVATTQIYTRVLDSTKRLTLERIKLE